MYYMVMASFHTHWCEGVHLSNIKYMPGGPTKRISRFNELATPLQASLYWFWQRVALSNWERGRWDANESFCFKFLFEDRWHIICNSSSTNVDSIKKLISAKNFQIKKDSNNALNMTLYVKIMLIHHFNEGLPNMV